MLDANWSLALPGQDVEDMIVLAAKSYGSEGAGVVTASEQEFRKNLTLAATTQAFDRSKLFLAICRTVTVTNAEVSGKLLGFCWFERQGCTSYSTEEISNSKFHFVDLALSVRQRLRLINDMIDQHILWASAHNVPIVCSSSIRRNYEGFIRIHRNRGFDINGSYALIRTEAARSAICDTARLVGSEVLTGE